MKRLVLFILVSVLGLCNSALARPMTYTPPAMYGKNDVVKEEKKTNVKEVVCKDGHLDLFDNISIGNYRYDTGNIYCEIKKPTFKADCYFYTDLDRPYFKGIKQEFISMLEQRIHKSQQEAFKNGICKVFDNDLNDITSDFIDKEHQKEEEAD